MTRETRWSAWAGRTIEACWLLALVFAPYFFNLLTARHFEPDKATVVRAIALVALAAWAIKTVERITALGAPINWRAWWRAPLALPALVFAGVFLLATVTSVDPSISWWGSYNRLQGAYTNLSYIALFAVIVGNLRTRVQLDRLITTIILSGFSVAVYGLIQHYGYDPLPWKGDVLTRISSTMGNSIFVAAYLIMVVPFVLYRIATSLTALRHARLIAAGSDALPSLQGTGGSGRDFIWGGALLLLLLGQQALLLGLLKVGAAIRVADFRYWWVFPLGLAVITASFALVGRRQTEAPGRALTLFTGGLLAFWALLFLIVYVASSGAQQLDSNPLVANWGTWLALGVVGVAAFLLASFFLPRRRDTATATFAALELAGYVGVLITLLLAIIFSQSRGPQIGLLAGLTLFVNLLLWRLRRNAAALALPRAGMLRGLLLGAIGVEFVAAALLLTFNLSRAPIFERLRQVPYVGRFGQLLETGEGTGRVRTLIWAGDAQGRGALGLIVSNPLRAIIGYGPETMFTVYNPFYPPELAKYESRGASPDRSHQAELDELVTKGALGLLSYFFLFLSAGWLAWRLIRGSTSFAFQSLFIACLAAIIAHLFEGLTGIPIVSTLTMLWITLGVIVAGGLLDGQLSLGPAAQAPSPAPAVAAPPVAAEPASRGKAGGREPGARQAARGRDSRAARGAGAQRAGAAPVTSVRRGGGFRWTYGLIALAALVGVWFWNLKVDYADMWYNQAAAFQPRSVDDELYRYSRVLNAVLTAPDEDYYYLQLGNSLIQLGYTYKASNPQSDADVAPPRPDQRFTDLLFGATAEERAANLWKNSSVEQLLEYARIVLERARALNPGNKDHYANLARLYALWYGLRQDPAKLEQSLRWYAEAHRIAPNDVVILNEWATTQTALGPSTYPEVEARLRQSEALDPNFADTYVKLGNLLRVEGKNALAVEQYIQALQRRPTALQDGRENWLDPAIAAFKKDPAALQRLMAAYQSAAQARPKDAQVQAALGRVAGALGDRTTVQAAFDRAIGLAPDNIGVRQQYTFALSETQQYDAALQQAQAGLQLAQSQQSKDQIDRFTKLVKAVQQRKASGGS